MGCDFGVAGGEVESVWGWLFWIFEFRGLMGFGSMCSKRRIESCPSLVLGCLIKIGFFWGVLGWD